MSNGSVTCSQDGAVWTVTLNRPEKGNSLDAESVETLLSLIAEAERESIRLMILRGSGRDFCTGFDLSDIADQSDGDLLHRFVRIELFLQRLHYASFATAAFCQGRAFGAGADLFCACTFRTAASAARFRFPGWSFGIALGTRRLVHRIGDDNARDLLLEGREVRAAEARSLGLAESIAEPDVWDDTARRIVRQMSRLEPVSNALLLSLTKLDARAADLLALVESASRPKLGERILAYAASVRSQTRTVIVADSDQDRARPGGSEDFR